MATTCEAVLCMRAEHDAESVRALRSSSALRVLASGMEVSKPGIML